jgi:hypothetical protein
MKLYPQRYNNRYQGYQHPICSVISVHAIPNRFGTRTPISNRTGENRASFVVLRNFSGIQESTPGIEERMVGQLAAVVLQSRDASATLEWHEPEEADEEEKGPQDACMST